MRFAGACRHRDGGGPALVFEVPLPLCRLLGSHGRAQPRPQLPGTRGTAAAGAAGAHAPRAQRALALLPERGHSQVCTREARKSLLSQCLLCLWKGCCDTCTSSFRWTACILASASCASSLHVPQHVVTSRPGPLNEHCLAGDLEGHVKPACGICTPQMSGRRTLATSCPVCAPACLSSSEHVCAAQLFHGLLGLGEVGGRDRLDGAQGINLPLAFTGKPQTRCLMTMSTQALSKPIQCICFLPDNQDSAC